MVTEQRGGNTRGRQTRKAILEAAQQVFERKGYRDTSVADILKQAGLSRGGFYRHFAGKKDVVLALVREFFADMLTAVRTAASGGDTLASSAARMQAIVRTCAAHNVVVGLYIQSSEVDPDLKALRLSARDAVVQASTTALLQQSKGKLDENQAHVAAVAMEGMIALVLEEWFVRGRPFTADTVSQVLVLLTSAIEQALVERPPLPSELEAAYGRLNLALQGGRYDTEAAVLAMEGLTKLVEA